MTDQLDAATLRRWAMQCAAMADTPGISSEERERLRSMRMGLLSLAETQDWLNGRRFGASPSVQSDVP
jgi:hypothetical protein